MYCLGLVVPQNYVLAHDKSENALLLIRMENGGDGMVLALIKGTRSLRTTYSRREFQRIYGR